MKAQEKEIYKDTEKTYDKNGRKVQKEKKFKFPSFFRLFGSETEEEKEKEKERKRKEEEEERLKRLKEEEEDRKEEKNSKDN